MSASIPDRGKDMSECSAWGTDDVARGPVWKGWERSQMCHVEWCLWQALQAMGQEHRFPSRLTDLRMVTGQPVEVGLEEGSLQVVAHEQAGDSMMASTLMKWKEVALQSHFRTTFDTSGEAVDLGRGQEAQTEDLK